MKNLFLLLFASLMLSSCYSVTYCYGDMKENTPAVKVNSVKNHGLKLNLLLQMFKDTNFESYSQRLPKLWRHTNELTFWNYNCAANFLQGHCFIKCSIGRQLHILFCLPVRSILAL